MSKVSITVFCVIYINICCLSELSSGCCNRVPLGGLNEKSHLALMVLETEVAQIGVPGDPGSGESPPSSHRVLT